MKLSTKGRYAMVALADIALQGEDGQSDMSIAALWAELHNQTHGLK